jgi:hypothetical protein
MLGVVPGVIQDGRPFTIDRGDSTVFLIVMHHMTYMTCEPVPHHANSSLDFLFGFGLFPRKTDILQGRIRIRVGDFIIPEEKIAPQVSPDPRPDPKVPKLVLQYIPFVFCRHSLPYHCPSHKDAFQYCIFGKDSHTPYSTFSIEAPRLKW